MMEEFYIYFRQTLAVTSLIQDMRKWGKKTVKLIPYSMPFIPLSFEIVTAVISIKVMIMEATVLCGVHFLTKERNKNKTEFSFSRLSFF